MKMTLVVKYTGNRKKDEHRSTDTHHYRHCDPHKANNIYYIILIRKLERNIVKQKIQYFVELIKHNFVFGLGHFTKCIIISLLPYGF